MLNSIAAEGEAVLRANPQRLPQRGEPLMRTVGLIGGLTGPGASWYVRRINELVARRLGHGTTGDLVLVQTDYDAIVNCLRNGQFDQLAVILARLGDELESAEVDFCIVVPGDDCVIESCIEQHVKRPFIRVADPVAWQILSHGIRSVGLLRCRAVIGEDEFARCLQNDYDLKVLPAAAAVNGPRDAAAGANARAAVDSLLQQGAEAIVLGSVSAGLALRSAGCPVPLFDAAAIHIKAAVDAALHTTAPSLPLG